MCCNLFVSNQLKAGISPNSRLSFNKSPRDCFFFLDPRPSSTMVWFCVTSCCVRKPFPWACSCFPSVILLLAGTVPWPPQEHKYFYRRTPTNARTYLARHTCSLEEKPTTFTSRLRKKKCISNISVTKLLLIQHKERGKGFKTAVTWQLKAKLLHRACSLFRNKCRCKRIALEAEQALVTSGMPLNQGLEFNEFRL